MTMQTFVVGVHPYGERYRAVVVAVHDCGAAEVEARLAAGVGLAGEDLGLANENLLAVTVKDTARKAVEVVVVMATTDIADEVLG